MTKGLISIFAQPQELDDLHITLYNLKRNVSMLRDDVQFDIDLTFCISDELTDWDKSLLPKQYFIDKFNTLLPLLDWSKSPNIRLEDGNEILGCVSQRRRSLSKLEEYDFTIWMDCDLFFKDTTLMYLAAGYDALIDQGHTHFVLTPQFVKQWDSTWDPIVNNNFLQHKLDYELEADIFNDTLIDYGDVSIRPLNTFKFAGGWCTLISNQLLKLIGVPQSFGHYGMEDTFIVETCKILQANNYKPTPMQFIIENHLVGENYVHRCNNHMKTYVTSRNRKEEFRSVATANFSKEIKLLMERV